MDLDNVNKLCIGKVWSLHQFSFELSPVLALVCGAAAGGRSRSSSCCGGILPLMVLLPGLDGNDTSGFGAQNPVMFPGLTVALLAVSVVGRCRQLQG